MKLLFLTGKYPPNSTGGGEISTALISDGLRARGHTITVVTDAELPGLTDKPLFERSHAKRLAKKLMKLKANEANIVHAHDFRSGLVLYELIRLGAVRPEQACITLRDYAAVSGDTNAITQDGAIPKNPGNILAAWNSYRVWEASFPRNMGRFLQYVLNVSYRQKALLSIPYQVFISNAERDYIRSVVDEKLGVEQEVIYNPVDAEYLQPVTPVSGKTVLYVGRLEEYKGVGLLLKSWSELLKQAPDAKLQLVGQGAQAKDYQDFVRKQGLNESVEFVPHMNYLDMLQTYDEASVVVAPHLWVEPFGRTVAEGMARGRVVVASDTGGSSELIEDSVTGLLFKRGSQKALIAKLVTALQMSDEERSQMGAAAQDWVRDNLTQERIAQQYENFYLVR